MSRASRAGHGMVRIIGGELRSRRIRFEATRGLRPTPDRVRETVFNWLAPHVRGARCLDLYAGSGALGFEAASRGAASVTLVEQNRRAFLQLKDNRDALGLDPVVTVCHESAWSFLQGCATTFDIVFLDPPFDGSDIERVLGRLAAETPLAPGGMVYLERRAARDGIDDPPDWRTLKHGTCGDVDYRLAVRAAASGP